MIATIVEQRSWLAEALDKMEIVRHIYPSQANFLLVRFTDPNRVFDYLIENDIIVRNRSKVHKCEGCLRITVGSNRENQQLISTLKEFKS